MVPLYHDVNSCWDHGVIVTSDLTSSDHINDIVFKAHQRANAIHRRFISRNMLAHDYRVYVRPLLEYNSVIWSPRLKCDIEAIERVQRRFTKRLPGYHKYSYSERLRLLQLPSLETRRLQNDLIWCYKIVFRYTITYSDFFEFWLSNTRGHPYKLFKRQCSNATRSVFFRACD